MSYPEKSKKGKQRRSPVKFVIPFMIGHALAWVPFFMAPDFMFSSFDVPAFSIFTGLSVGLIASLTQYLGLRWLSGRNFKWWIPLSLLAWTLSAFVVYESDFASLDLRLIGLYVPVAIVQTLLLRKHVRHAWLWVIASFAGAAMDAMFDPLLGGNVWSAVFGFGLYGGLMGGILLWLFGMSQQPAKLRDVSSAETRLSDGQVNSESIPATQAREAHQQNASQ